DTVSSSQTFSVACSLDPPACDNQVNCVQIGTDAGSVTRLSDLVLGEHPVILSTQFFLSYLINDLCFTVEGQLIIDIGQVSFVNTDWYMGPGAEIEVTPTGVWGSRWFT